MRPPWRLCVLLTALPLVAMQTRAGGAWVLWVEAPAGSDQWSVVARLPAKDECERRAVYLNDAEKTVAKTQRMTGESLDVFSCLPETVDPRPEGALR